METLTFKLIPAGTYDSKGPYYFLESNGVRYSHIFQTGENLNGYIKRDIQSFSDSTFDTLIETVGQNTEVTRV